jgi:MFS family permease
VSEGRPIDTSDTRGSRERHPLLYRDYACYWLARLLTTIAQNAMVVVIGWQVYDVARLTRGTRDAALQLGLVGLAQFAPFFCLVLFAGWVADRIDRRYVFRACSAVQLLCAVALATMTLRGITTLAPLFSVAVTLGISRAFSMPASTALAPTLVPSAVLPRAVATSAIAGRVGAIIGPTLGGFLYAAAAAWPYLFAAALFAISLVLAMLIRPISRVTQIRGNPFRHMVEGLAYVWHHPIVLSAISLDMVAVLLGGATALLPIYARDILMVGPSGLGQLRAAPSIGALGAALWFAWRPLQRHVGAKMLASVAVFGVATAAFGLSRSMPLSLACLVVLGAADMLSVHVRQSLIQLSTPDAMRGRVGAVSSLFVSASNELGEAESGFLAALVGPVAAVTGGGIAAVVASIVWARRFPALRNAASFATTRDA